MIAAPKPLRWMAAAALLLATLAGVHEDASGYVATPGSLTGRTLKNPGPPDGCGDAAGCHTGNAQDATVTINGPAGLKPGELGTYRVRATKASLGSGVKMGVAVAASDPGSPLSGTTSNLVVQSGEVIHSSLGGALSTTNASGSAFYDINYTMPAGAALGSTHTLYAVARLGNAGGTWNHASNVTVTAVGTAPAITSAAPPSPGKVGTPYPHTYTATGNPAPTFSVTSGALPNGLTLNASSGAVTGTPTVAGTFNGTVTAANGTLPNATQNFSITVQAPPAFTSAAAPATGTLGVPYAHTYTATGNPPPTFTVTAGALPTGLALDAGTGAVTGTPTALGAFSGTVTAANGVTPAATQNFSVTIAAAPSAPSITSPAPPGSGTVGVAYSHTYTATGNPPPNFSVSGGALPTGLTLNGNTGAVTGTPTVAGTFNGTVRAANGVNPAATQNFSITVVGVTIPNYQGLWWADPPGSESGWGINFAHQGDIIFATWFTYDLAGKPWWLAVVATPVAPGVYTGDLFTTAGPPFNAVPFAPSPTETTVGTATFTFSDDNHATFEYTVNVDTQAKSAITQTKNITRQEFGTLPGCVWGGEPNLALATNYQDLWWNDPPFSESGWGINLTHQDDLIFVTWFTYDADGKPWWLAFLVSLTAPGVYSGDVFTTTGPPLNAVPFAPPAVETTVGTVVLTFTDGNHATFAYTVNGISQTKQIIRQVFVEPGTACK